MSKHRNLLLLTYFLLFPTMVSAQTCSTSSMPATTAHMVGNSNGTVTDPKTGLIWKRCSEGQTWNGSGCNGTPVTYAWRSALLLAQAVNTGQTGTENQGFTDWRLPNIKELQSLIERQCYGPAINITNFPNTPNGADEAPPWYWSATPVASGNQAWAVSSYDGNSYLPKNFSDKTDLNYVRLVRGGY